MAEMPKSVQVGPYTYTVLVDQAKMNLLRVEYANANQVGSCDFWQHQIVLAPEPCGAVQRETLLHEVMHACHKAVGIDANTKLTPEELLARTGVLVLDTLQRNPDLVAYLTEGTQ